jgi:small-conductance mechanosensitive channel
VMLAVRFWTPTAEWFDVKSTLLWQMKQALEQSGLEMPFPQRMVWLAKEPPVMIEPPPAVAPPAKRRRRATPKAP